MSETVQQLMRQLKEKLSALYGPRLTTPAHRNAPGTPALKGVYLFGSCARGEAEAESDVDVLIVLDRVDNYAMEIDRSSELIAELSLEYGRSISCVYVSEERWRQDQTMFLINVREEAIPA